jgi:hypothetical protein
MKGEGVGFTEEPRLALVVEGRFTRSAGDFKDPRGWASVNCMFSLFVTSWREFTDLKE